MEAKITEKKRVKLSEIFYFGEKKDRQTKPMKHICQTVRSKLLNNLKTYIKKLSMQKKVNEHSVRPLQIRKWNIHMWYWKKII